MIVSPIGNGIASPVPAAPAGGTPALTPQRFQDVVGNFLQDVNTQQLAVGQQIEGLVTGETDNIHDVVLTVAKADLAFRLALEIRNRLVASYQELMRMQV